MYIFAYFAKDTFLYPPHGIRVAVFASVDELITSIYDHLGDTVDASITIATAMNPKELEDILDQHLEGSWSIFSDEHGYLPEWDATRFRVEYHSPDGLSIHPGETYTVEHQLSDAINRFVDRFRHQGYYSSVQERISLDDLPQRCRVVWVESDDESDDVPDVVAAGGGGGVAYELQPTGRAVSFRSSW